jgi:type II secretion system protein G
MSFAETRSEAARGDIRTISTVLEMYKADTGSYPTQRQGLEALCTKPEDIDSSLSVCYFERLPKDPWRNDYVYVFPGRKSREGFDLYTLGKDGETATAGNDPDDINNWDPESGRSYYLRTEITEGTVIRRIGVLVLLVACGVYACGIIIRALRREST